MDVDVLVVYSCVINVYIGKHLEARDVDNAADECLSSSLLQLTE